MHHRCIMPEKLLPEQRQEAGELAGNKITREEYGFIK